jgi:carboxyl-terminal processing protease
MFYTPGGFSTQHRGVEGDIVLPSAWSTEEIGEKSLDYSLPPKKIAPFISEEAYVKSGPGAWKPIESAWVTILKERSKQRVEKSEDYKKIVAEIKKAEARGKVIKLSEVTKEKGEKEKKDKTKKFAPKEEKEKEYLGRADIKEAVDVLADLLVVSNSEKLAPLVFEAPQRKVSEK